MLNFLQLNIKSIKKLMLSNKTKQILNPRKRILGAFQPAC